MYKILIITILIYVTYQFLRCTCMQINNQYECEYAGCFWRNRICIDIQCENRVSEEECSQKPNSGDENLNCRWYEDKCYDVNQLCSLSCNNTHFCYLNNEKCEVVSTYRDVTCSNLVAEADCTNKKIAQDKYCQWNKETIKCDEINIDSSCSSILSKTMCEGMYCQWSEQTNLCRDKLCTSFRTNDTCIWALNETRGFTLCQWNTTRDYCLGADEGNSEQLKNLSSCSIDTQYAYYNDGKQCSKCGSVSSHQNLLKFLFLYYIIL